MLYEVLVALKLGRGVAAHILVVVGRHGTVENVHREVQHAVLRVFVGLDHLVHGPLNEGLVEVLGSGEMAFVEVPLAGDEQVHQHKDADKRCCQGTVLLFSGEAGEPDQACSGRNQEEGAKGIGLQKGYAVGDEGIHHNILHAFVAGAGETSDEARGQPAQQAEAAGNAESPAQCPQKALFVVLSLDDAVQHQKPQHGQGHLQQHQGHGDRPELVIKRQILETEGGKGYEMIPHGHEDRQHNNRQQPPFFASLI